VPVWDLAAEPVPKYFYDDLGSALFEAITRLPEYYLTRVERDLLATYGREIAGALDGPVELVELGSGKRGEDAPADRRDPRTPAAADLSTRSTSRPTR